MMSSNHRLSHRTTLLTAMLLLGMGVQLTCCPLSAQAFRKKLNIQRVEEMVIDPLDEQGHPQKKQGGDQQEAATPSSSPSEESKNESDVQADTAQAAEPSVPESNDNDSLIQFQKPSVKFKASPAVTTKPEVKTKGKKAAAAKEVVGPEASEPGDKTDKKKAATGKKTLPPSEAAAPDLSKLSPETQAEMNRLSASLLEQNQAIFNELKDEEETSTKDVAMLWQSAVERSGTIRYAIEKLSRRDATGKPVANDSFTKRMLQSIARVGGVAGSVWTGNPAAMMSGGMVEQLIQGDPTDPALVRVTDADMLILAKEVESLQSLVIESYYSYKHTQERWQISQEAIKTLDKYHKTYNESDRSNTAEAIAIRPIIDSLFQTAQHDEQTAKQAFVQSRNALGLLVGGDALVALEKFQQDKQAKSASKNTP